LKPTEHAIAFALGLLTKQFVVNRYRSRAHVLNNIVALTKRSIDSYCCPPMCVLDFRSCQKRPFYPFCRKSAFYDDRWRLPRTWWNIL